MRYRHPGSALATCTKFVGVASSSIDPAPALTTMAPSAVPVLFVAATTLLSIHGLSVEKT